MTRLSQSGVLKRYSATAPGWPYAGTFYGENLQHVKQVIRKWLGVQRLPRGTSVWEAPE